MAQCRIMTQQKFLIRFVGAELFRKKPLATPTRQRDTAVSMLKLKHHVACVVIDFEHLDSCDVTKLIEPCNSR